MGEKLTLKPRDVELFSFLLSIEGEVTTTDICRRFFGVSSRDDLVKKDAFMRYWLERFHKKGLIERRKNGEKVVYQVNRDRVRAGRVRFTPVDGKSMVVDVLSFEVSGFGALFVQLPESFELSGD